ncbi:DUF3800 domain-containing protein [Nocardioides speluncae]|uniref:DUF3800 domain-containing protein n=1 Tax=Nocardioides speluncae TaxID=2670337 RepID=UPI000D68D593|nr:DUF3800 domain-containing protein [Nocardioides speluncae]
MLLTYVDESYTKERYYIAGLAVHHDAIRSLESELAGVVTKARRTCRGVTAGSELHGHPLFHGKEDWAQLQPRQRIGVYGDALQAIADHDVRIFLRGLDIPAQRKRYGRPIPPHDVVLQHLLERVNGYAARTDQAALIIADELQEDDRHRKNLTDFRMYGTPGYLSSELPRIVDTIHFAPSHHSRLLQAADLVAFLHRRLETHTETDLRATRANAALWARIRARVEHQHCWRP